MYNILGFVAGVNPLEYYMRRKWRYYFRYLATKEFAFCVDSPENKELDKFKYGCLIIPTRKGGKFGLRTYCPPKFPSGGVVPKLPSSGEYPSIHPMVQREGVVSAKVMGKALAVTIKQIKERLNDKPD